MRKLLLMIFFVFLGVVYFYNTDSTKKTIDSSPSLKKKNKLPTKSKTNKRDNQIVKRQKTKETSSKHRFRKLLLPHDTEYFSKSERKSIEFLSNIIISYTKEVPNIERLMDQLKDKKLSPYRSLHKNKEIGDMHMIRTNKSLNGTRYFHAQFFSEERQNNLFMQHISFEIKAGKGHFEQTINQMIKIHKLGAPKFNKERNFVSWSINGDYILWIKKMESSDIKNSLFNAYDKSDIGTIRVVIELEIH